DNLYQAVVDEGVRKIVEWTARFRLVEVDFPPNPIDPFHNVNSPEDLIEAEKILAEKILAGSM
ncbi:MAG: hypothetical protein HOH26_07730, partial [Alphaproteobacteria bacterium]|nr:hypothetical protein [Alphaproteobacteria bacterium]